MTRKQPLLLTVNADCQLKSTAQETYTPAELHFVNASREAKAIYWLDYEGQAKFHLWLRPGESKEYNSFIGHPWCVVNTETNEALQVIIVSEAEQTISIP